MKTRTTNCIARAAFLGLSALLTLTGIAASAQQGQIVPSRDVGLDQKLDAQVPLDIPFRDEAGNIVPLSTYFHGKPVALIMPFYRCAGVCTLELNILTKNLKKLQFTPGKEFELVVVSINPKETPILAAAKKEEYMEVYKRPEGAKGWHFLTGEQSSIQRLAQAVGFRYVYDVKTDNYAHPAGLMLITPEGKMSRYFLTLNYNDTDLRLGLVEASQNHIGTLVDNLLTYCLHYDATTGKYDFAIKNILKITGIGTVLILGSFMLIMFRREKSMMAAKLRAAQAAKAADGGTLTNA